jgi:hypothetical protein
MRPLVDAVRAPYRSTFGRVVKRVLFSLDEVYQRLSASLL